MEMTAARKWHQQQPTTAATATTTTRFRHQFYINLPFLSF